jgi:hypothetical protein
VIDLTTAEPQHRRPRHSRRPLIVGVAAAAVLLVVAVVVAAALRVRPTSTAARPLGPLEADAVRACRTAINDDGRQRAARADAASSMAVTVVSDVQVGEARWGVYRHSWTVDGTIHFSTASTFGVLPLTVDVLCTASKSSGGVLITAVNNR